MITQLSYLQRLPVQFSKNSLPYKLIMRNEIVAIYGVGGTYYPDELHYEVVKIQRVPEKVLFGKTMPSRESLPSNEQFGKEGSRSIVYLERAKDYFQELTDKLKSKNEAPKNHSMEKNSFQEGVGTTLTLKSTMKTHFNDTTGT